MRERFAGMGNWNSSGEGGDLLDFLIAVDLMLALRWGVGIFWVSVFKRLGNVAFARGSEFLKADSEDGKQGYGDWK